jgi:hypothetical protein
MPHAKGSIQVDTGIASVSLLPPSANPTDVLITNPATPHGVEWGPVVNGLLISPVTPVRTFNTTFTPHLTRPVLAVYTVEITCVTTLLSGDDGTIELRSDTNPTPTTVRASCRNRLFQTVGTSVGTQSIVRTALTYIVPPGSNVRLVTIVTVALPVFTLVTSVETII